MNQPNIYSVKHLVGELRALLDERYGEIWVQGEVSNLATPASGHRYFALVEDDAVIRCALFKRHGRAARLQSEVRDGMRALVRARVSLYEARGDLQLIVAHIVDAGEGALRRAFEKLKRKLDDEGLFDQRHKQPLPSCPRAVGVISSPSGAALHDVRVTLARRYPPARLIVYPSLVQGDAAPENLIKMISIANQRAEVDVLIVARGGGSLEDLNAFNDEGVARAIFQSQLPLVSAVGHEIDFTIADFVADVRAPTPTAAAELVVPDIAELRAELKRTGMEVYFAMQNRLDDCAQQQDQLDAQLRTTARRLVDACAQQLQLTVAHLVHPLQRIQTARQTHRIAGRDLIRSMHTAVTRRRNALAKQTAAFRYLAPQTKVQQTAQRVDAAHAALTRAARERLDAARRQTAQLANAVQLISPKRTLERGYAILQDEQNAVITDAARAQKGQHLTARVARGRLECIVEDTTDEDDVF